MELYRTMSSFLSNYDSQNSLGSYFRRRRARLVSQLIVDAFSKHNKVNIIDIGGRESYWGILSDEFLEQHRVHITLVNDSAELDIKHVSTRFSHVVADGCSLECFDNHAFEISHCNSVIEHVGCWKNMKNLAREIERLAPSYYVQTPNFWFPFEPHFMAPVFHWLPRMMRIALIQKMPLGHMRRQTSIEGAIEVIDSVELLNSRVFFSLFDGAKHKKERFLGLPKSLIAYK